MNIKHTAFLLLVALAGVPFGCSPPHVNPLDPDSPSYIPPTGEAPQSLVTRVRSVHTSRNLTALDTYAVLAEAWSGEPDPLDTAWVVYRDFPSEGMRLTTEGIWSVRLTSSYFNDARLGSVIGQPFAFSIRTSSETLYVRTPVYLFRVIESTPLLISPRNGETASPRPILIWGQFSATFPFTFEVSVIIHGEDFEPVIWISEELPSDTLSVSVPDSLEDAAYYWTVTVRDAFGNTSRSKEGEFVVAAGGIP